MNEIDKHACWSNDSRVVPIIVGSVDSEILATFTIDAPGGHSYIRIKINGLAIIAIHNSEGSST